MAKTSKIEVVLETGDKRTFASALDWPGWARPGPTPEGAVEALMAYASRYQAVVGRRRLGFKAPDDVSVFEVTERLKGNATTDFGAPNIAAEAEAAPISGAEMKHLKSALAASWDALAKAVDAAQGKELRKGPRGGGRTTAKVLEHVFGAHGSYLRHLFFHDKLPEGDDLEAKLATVKRADAKAMAFAESDEMPEKGLRGGQLWKPRYFARRAAWHILDHAWEIEDRIEH